MFKTKKTAAILVSLLVLIQVVGVIAAAQYEDIDYDNPDQAWLYEPTANWGELFAEDGEALDWTARVTRGEMAYVINSIMGFPAAEATFDDVNADTVYAADIGALQAAGVIDGIGANMYAPDALVKRAEVAKILAIAFAIPQNAEAALELLDEDLGDYAYVAPYLVPLMQAAYLRGEKVTDEGTLFSLSKNMSRGHILAAVYQAAGSSVIDADIADVTLGNVVIAEAGVTLSNVTIDGNLIIAPSVGDGDVYFEDVTVNGSVFVRGGGENSIHINGLSNIARIVVDKIGSSSIRIFAEDSAAVANVMINGGAPAIVEGKVDAVTVNAETALTLKATVESLNVSVADAKVTVTAEAVVENLYVALAATNADVEISGTVTAMTVAAPAAVIAVTEEASIVNLNVTGSAAGADINNKGAVTNLVVKNETTLVDNTGTIETATAPEAVTIIGATENLIVDADAETEIYVA